MTPDIKRILYATDLSGNSAYAFGYAMNLAKKYDAEITILHVIDKTREGSKKMYAGIVNAEQLGGNLQKIIPHMTKENNKRLKIFIDKNAADDPELPIKSPQ